MSHIFNMFAYFWIFFNINEYFLFSRCYPIFEERHLVKHMPYSE